MYPCRISSACAENDTKTVVIHMPSICILPLVYFMRSWNLNHIAKKLTIYTRYTCGEYNIWYRAELLKTVAVTFYNTRHSKDLLMHERPIRQLFSFPDFGNKSHTHKRSDTCSLNSLKALMTSLFVRLKYIQFYDYMFGNFKWLRIYKTWFSYCVQNHMLDDISSVC